MKDYKRLADYPLEHDKFYLGDFLFGLFYGVMITLVIVEILK